MNDPLRDLTPAELNPRGNVTKLIPRSVPKAAEPTGEDVAINFLAMLHPGGPWVLTAIVPDGPIITITARTASEVRAFVREHNGKRNLYYAPNPVRRSTTKKAAKADVAAIEFMLADLDPEPGETSEQTKKRYLAQLKNFAPRPTAIIDSGNGIQTLWQLDERINLPEGAPENETRIADAEARSKALMERLGAKAGTQNVDRILRLPGTTNLPNAKKKRDGRVACPAKLLEFNEIAHPLDAFPLPVQQAAPNPGESRTKLPPIDFDNLPDVDFSTLPVSDEIKAALDSDGSEIGGGDRSAGVARVAWALARAGCSDEDIASILWSEPIGAHCHDQPDPERAIRRAIAFARRGDAANEFDTVEIAPDKAERTGVSRSDFYAYMPMHNYIYAPSRDTWPASSVNARVAPVPLVVNGKTVLDKNGKPATISAAAWLDRMRPVEQMTWAPGLPMIIRDRLISGGGWIERKGVACFNLYRPPTIKPGKAAEAGPWLDHVYKVFPNDAEHIIKWLAHRVQRPDIKINHALVFGGDQGIGKDTILEPVKHAIGPWNFSEVSPQNMLGRFNGFLKSVISRISEARDLGEVDRFAFYDHLKAYTAAPPDVLRVDEKNLREYSILNCVGIVITTNHKTDGIYLPADDRRNFVAWSDCRKTAFADSYWNQIYRWYNNGGNCHVAAYLAELDLSTFDPKAPPPKTAAFWEIVNANHAPEDAELADVLDRMGNPEATTIAEIITVSTEDLWRWFKDPKNRRVIPHRLEKCGYVSASNEAAQDGLWKINDRRQAVYVKKSLSPHDRFEAAKRLVAHGPTRSAILEDLFCGQGV